MDIWVGRWNLSDLFFRWRCQNSGIYMEFGFIQLVFSSIYSSYYLKLIMAKLHPSCHSSTMMSEDNWNVIWRQLPVDIRIRFKVGKTSYRRWNDVVYLQGFMTLFSLKFWEKSRKTATDTSKICLVLTTWSIIF